MGGFQRGWVRLQKQIRTLQRLSWEESHNGYAFAVGTVAGGVTGMVGWGGAQVIVPSMTMAGYPPLTATGFSLTALSLSIVSSGWKFWRDQHVHIPLALAIGIPAVFAARMGTHLARRLSSDALSLVFNGLSIVLIPTHFWIQQQASKGKETRNSVSDRNIMNGALPMSFSWHDCVLSEWGQHIVFGSVSGFVSALMGVGGLPLTMSYLTAASPLSEHHDIQGTALCALAPSVLVAAASQWKAVPLATAAVLCSGATLGSYLGAQAALQLSEDDLRHIYMGSLVVFGGRSIYGAAQNLRRILQRHN